MSFRYQIKKGYENREFVGARRLSETELESDEELFSPYLEELAANPEAAVAPSEQQPVQPTEPVDPVLSPAPPTIETNQQTTNTEGNN